VALKKSEPAILCVSLESNAAIEAAIHLAGIMREVGLDVGLYSKVLYRRITEWPEETAVSAFALADAICIGENLDDLKSWKTMVREGTACLEAISKRVICTEGHSSSRTRV